MGELNSDYSMCDRISKWPVTLRGIGTCPAHQETYNRFRCYAFPKCHDWLSTYALGRLAGIATSKLPNTQGGCYFGTAR